MPLEVTIDQDVLRVGPGFAVSFQRTLRIPDDGSQYPLPPGLGRFALRRRDGELLLPIQQCEALRVSFEGIPHAVKVAIGGIDALTGGFWDPTCLFTDPQDYLVSGDQPWLDGINAGDGVIAQFGAVLPGSVEGHVTGEETMSDLQLLVVPPRPGRLLDGPMLAPKRTFCASSAMDLGAGGRVRQDARPDQHGVDTWDIEHATVVEIRLCSGDAWTELTGEAPPPTPIDATTYRKFGLPWPEPYAQDRDIAPSRKLVGLRSISGGRR